MASSTIHMTIPRDSDNRWLAVAESINYYVGCDNPIFAEVLKLELRHLRYFIRAAELLHFTRAAESLYISQPSLSVHIHQLEEELKTKLFGRGARGVHLTETGLVFLEHAKRAVQELEVAEKEIDAMTGLLRGTLTIATVPLYGSKILPGWIN